MLVMGLTFKENVKDVRNSKSKPLITELKEYCLDVLAHDPLLTQEDVDEEKFGVKLFDLKEIKSLDAIIIAVPHKQYMDRSFSSMYATNSAKIFFDIKGSLDKTEMSAEGIQYIKL